MIAQFAERQRGKRSNSIGREAREGAIIIFIGTGDFTGAPKMGWYLANAFKHVGDQVIAVVGPRPASGTAVSDRLQADGIFVIEETGFDGLWSFSLARRLARRLRAIGPALIVSVVQNDFKIAALVAKSLSVPFVVWGQSLTTFYGSGTLRRLKEVMFGILVRKYARLVVCCSSGVAEQFEQVHRVQEERVIVIPNGIEVAAFEQTHREAPVTADGRDSLNVLNVGRLDIQKGQDILLDALAALPVEDRRRVRVSFIGRETMGSKASSSFLAVLRLKAEDPVLGTSVTFLGWRDDIPEMLGKFDIYVHPARWEGLPLAVLEAMAAGLPTIYTDCSGAFEGFVNGVHGFMVKAGDPNSLGSALLEMLSLTPTERFAMGQKSRQLVREHYDVSAIGKRFVARCHEVMGQRDPT